MKDLVSEITKEQQRIALQLEKSLNSQDKSPKNLRRINYIQRSLLDIADYAFRIPEFFAKDLIVKVYNLLVRAREYLQGTEYEERALERPQEFVERANSMMKARTYKQCTTCATL